VFHICSKIIGKEIVSLKESIGKIAFYVKEIKKAPYYEVRGLLIVIVFGL
jgi:hypothetical protein